MFDNIELELDQRYDIVDGEFVRNDETGRFVVTDQQGVDDSIYLPKRQLVTSSWLGKPYRWRRQDCVSVIADYIDEIYGTTYWKQYMKTPTTLYSQCVLEGMKVWLDASDDWDRVWDLTDLQKHDVLIVDLEGYTDDNSPHCQLNLGDGTVFSQPHMKITSIDPLDNEIIQRIYRNNKIEVV